MKKILSILICLVLGISSAWAVTATIEISATAEPANGGTVRADGGYAECAASVFGTCLSYKWTSVIGTTSSLTNPTVTTTATSHDGKLDQKAQVTLHAMENTGYYFVGWYEGATNISSNKEHTITYSLSETGPRAYIAKFAPVTVTGVSTVKNISINELNGIGSGSVVFNVANADDVDDFLVSSLSNEFSAEITSISGNVVTVSVQYTDKNHHGNNVASADITLTSRGDANSKVTATINVSTNLTPTYTKPADFDFGTIYAGDARGSQTALYVTGHNESANQASPASSGATGAKWTATLSGAGAAAYALNSENPERGQVVVTFRPTTAGRYDAILTLEVEYTDAYGNMISSGVPTETALTGVAETPISSAIVFDPISWDFGTQITGYKGTKEVIVSQQNVSNVTYSFGETNPHDVFSYEEGVGSIFVSTTPTAPGTYNATITATGNDIRDGHSGEKVQSTLSLSINVGLQSPVLYGGSNLKDTYYLKWTKVPHATNYEIYEVNGSEQILVETAVEVVSDETFITKSIASADAEKTYIVKVISNYNGGNYESWSNQTVVNLNELTVSGVPYLDIYTGTTLTSMSGFGGTKVAKKKVNLINTFDLSGKALFDELYVFGETVSSDGKSSITAATTTSANTAVTPCYVFTKSGDTYVLSNTIENVNQANKQLPNATNRCWTIKASQNKKLYFTGFCPFGSNGSTGDDEGIVYIKGASGTSVDVYLEDCQLYARCHTLYGDPKGKDDPSMNSFKISMSYGGALGGILGMGSAATTANAAGSASAIVFECTDKNNSSAPFSATVHTRGNNMLYSHLGCSGYLNEAGYEARIGQYSASLQVRVTNTDSYTVLSFDDKWPIDVNNYELNKRTNGYLGFKKASPNAPSIEMGNENTVVNFNGGQIELQNSVPEAERYLNTLAICSRLGYATYSGLELFVGYGLGQDVVGGEVNFNDGTVNAERAKPKEQFRTYFEIDAEGYTTTLRCPAKTYITGGSHNSDVRACTAVDKTGGSPKDKKGNALVKLDYQLPGDANIQVDSETGLVIPTSMPNTFTCVGCGEDGSNTVLDVEHYGKYSLSPDKNNYIHLWAPGAGRVEYNITSWILSLPSVTATYSGNDKSLGGDVIVPSEVTDKVNNLLYAQIDDNMYQLLTGEVSLSSGKYRLPAELASTYVFAEISNVGETIYGNIMNDHEYIINEAIYYVTPVTADEWMLFSPPFDVSNMYVVETSSESELEALNDRSEALKLQAMYNMDFAAILAGKIETDKASNTNRSFLSHFDAFKGDYAKSELNRKNTDYSNDVKRIKLIPFTGANYNANFFLYKSENNEWPYENDNFTTDWDIAQPITKIIGETSRNVIMEAGEVYALQFPFCPNCEDLLTRTYWDYWTGKFILFEGYGPQTIPGRNVAKMIAEEEYTTSNSGQLRGNPIFAEYQVNLNEGSAEGYLPNALFVDSYDNLFYPGETHFEGGLLKAGGVYMVANIESPSNMPRRIASINPQTGEITYRDETTTSVPTIGGNKQMIVYNIDGGVGIVPVVEQQVSVYNAAGQLVTSQNLTDEVHIPLPSGIYLIAGAKEQFKVVVK